MARGQQLEAASEQVGGAHRGVGGQQRQPQQLQAHVAQQAERLAVTARCELVVELAVEIAIEIARRVGGGAPAQWGYKQLAPAQVAIKVAEQQLLQLAQLLHGCARRLRRRGAWCAAQRAARVVQ